KLAKSLESSGNNVTGASNFVPIKYIVQLLNRIKPVKSLGVLYSEAERNSVIQVEEMRKIKDEMGYSLTEINVSAKEQLKDATLKLAEAKVDFIFVTGSAVVSKNTSIILEVANANKIGTVSHLPEIVKEGGVLISISANAFKLGELSGKKAAQILKGANPSSLAIETLSNYDITLNMKTAKNMDLYIPNDVFKSATEIIK
ncbi:MAG: ABC transporter substrate-binding protein, partial [Candidatus Omnitrophica bacterium]|nr:ABC transporter substrate-binding protein [Candidatus Omnitrophota bacterium]